MNITFLIGNGFDRNLGLETTYSEFVSIYKEKTAHTKNLIDFRRNIKANEELWSDAEIALGQYTAQFGEGSAAAFSECHADICAELAKYLREQQSRVEYNQNAQKIAAAFSRMNKILEPFPEQERIVLDDIYSTHKNENRVFNFICFNYTDTLDKCIETMKKKNADALGKHAVGNMIFNHSIGTLCHVHGTIEKEMVFGVNDDTQIAKNEIFDCTNGDIYKNLLIKQNANASYQENTDSKAAKILNSSHIVYIYGMSIGITDKLWWERVCKWLAASNDHHLIVQKYTMPAKGVFPVKYQISEREYRNQIAQYGNYDEKTRKAIESRIHITNDNVFEEMKNIVPTSEERERTEK